jgi:hypothetical protein
VQHQTRLERVDDLVVEARLAVLCDDLSVLGFVLLAGCHDQADTPACSRAESSNAAVAASTVVSGERTTF